MYLFPCKFYGVEYNMYIITSTYDIRIFFCPNLVRPNKFGSHCCAAEQIGRKPQ